MGKDTVNTRSMGHGMTFQGGIECRLPWDRPRKKQPPREEISQHATKIILPDPADLAAAVDDQPLRSKEEEVRSPLSLTCIAIVESGASIP